MEEGEDSEEWPTGYTDDTEKGGEGGGRDPEAEGGKLA